MANTKAQLARLRWDLVLKTAALVYVATLVLGLVLSVPVLIFLNVGNLQPQNAGAAAGLLVALLVMVVTGVGAFRVARMVDHAPWLHGFLVGLIVALISCFLDVLFIRTIDLVGLILYALMAIAGWLGGVLGARWRRPLAAPES